MSWLSECIADGAWGIWLNDETSGTTLADSSGNSRPMTTTNSPTLNQSGPFTGSSSIEYGPTNSPYASTSATFGSAASTTETWVYIPAAAATGRSMLVAPVVSFDGTAFSGGILGVETGADVLVYQTNTIKVTTSAISRDTWYHVVGSVGAAGTKIRVNKVTLASNAATAASATAYPVFQRGFYNGVGSGSDYRGSTFVRLGPTAIYASQLSDARTDAHYDAAMVVIPQVTASLTGAGAFGATAVEIERVSALLAGSGALSATQTQIESRAASLAGSGALTATSYEVLSATGSMTGSGTLTAASSGVHAVDAVLTGTGEFTASIATDTLGVVDADLTGSGAFTATSYPVFGVDADLTGSGAVTATSYAVRSVTGTMTGTGTFGTLVEQQLTVEGDVSTGYGSEIDGTMVVPAPAYLGVLDPVVDQPPATITVVMSGLTPLATVTFRIDDVIVGTGTADVQGDVDATSLVVDRQFAAGAHVVSGTTADHEASAAFTITADATTLPAVPAPDAPPAVVPDSVGSNGVQRWVFQDPGGLGSWIMPINPTAMSNPHVRKSVGAVVTTAVHGRPHVSEGARPVEWEFSGLCLSEAFQDQLIAYSELPRRFYLIDHRNRAWTVAIASLDIRPRKRVMENGVAQDWLADYTARVVLFSQTPQTPESP